MTCAWIATPAWAGTGAETARPAAPTVSVAASWASRRDRRMAFILFSSALSTYS